jgi:formate dehydrogenase subunit gamma
VSADDKILRFRAAERHLHWAIAIPFKVCYLTALILVVVYNPHPHRPLRELLSWIHRLSGVCLAILPPAAIAFHWREWRVHLENVRIAWSWSLHDIKWLALMAPAAVTSRVRLPDQDKFNAAEKINFMSLTLTYPVYVMTGVTIWFFGPPYISWLVHFSLAVAATPLLAGHIFMATVNPETRAGLEGMITGWVDRHWARHHYALWYTQEFGAQGAPPRPPAPVVILPAKMREAGPASAPSTTSAPEPSAVVSRTSAFAAS